MSGHTGARPAAGTRFIGRKRIGLPEAISLGEVHVPTSSNCYRSVFWLALRGSESQPSAEFFDRLVCPEIERRFRSHHWTDRKKLLLNNVGIRRAARLTHIDALGLLLLQCRPWAQASEESLSAERYIDHLFLRLCARDSVFNELREVMKDAITVYFKHAFCWNQSKKASPFQTQRLSAFAVPFARLFDPLGLSNRRVNPPR